MLPPLPAADFEALRRLIREHSGMWLGDTRQVFLQLQVAGRLQACHISTAREYYLFLKYDPGGPAELQQLLDAVAVNETWFFRETTPLEAWRDNVLPGLLARNGRVRLWSAACSTGEEPYTLAMLLLDKYPLAQAFEITATDLSQRALTAARAAVYDSYSLRHTAERWQDKYFRPAEPAGRQQVIDPVRRLVSFGRGNLLDPSLAARVGPVDLILCRNVLIYFDPASRQQALANLHAALRPGGHLVVGHSEMLTHAAAPFVVSRLDGSLLYQRPPKV